MKQPKKTTDAPPPDGTEAPAPEGEDSVEELKKVKRKLEASEGRLRDAFENSPVGMYRTTPGGKILMANAAMLKMLGFSSYEELAGRNLENDGFVSDYPRDRFKAAMERDGEVRGMESRWTKRDGTLIHIRETARAVRDEDGKTMYYEGIAEDITEQLDMQEALSDSEGYFKALFDGARDAVLIADAGTGIIEDANKEAESLFQYPREELIGIHFSKLHPPEKRYKFTRFFEKQVKKGGHPPIQTLILTGDGRTLDADLSSTVIVLANGRKVTYGVFRDITERLKAERERVKMLAERSAILEALGDGLVTLDMDGRITSVNSALERMVGFSKEELLGNDIMALLPDKVPGDTLNKIMEAWETSASGKAPPSEALRIRTKGGAALDISFTTTFIKDAAGEPAAMVVTIKDITGILKAEEERRKVSAERAAIIESMGDGLVKVDMDGNITETNPALERMLGYERNELVGRNILSLLTGKVSGDTLERVMSMLSAAVEGKMPPPTEISAQTRDGRPITISFSPSFLKDDSGEPIAMVATIREVTDIARAREELRASQRRFSHFVEGIPEGVFVVDAEGRPAYANHAFQLLVGKSIQEIEKGLDDKSLLETFGAYVSGTDQPYPAERDPLVRALSGEGSTASDMDIRWPDKDVPVEVTGAPIYDENGNILYSVAIYRDITERKTAEEKIRASLAEKELLLKEIHHRVKNNLQIIISLLNLQAQTIADPKVQEVLKDSQERVRAMALIHEKLYKSADIASVEFSDYVRNLVERLLRTYAVRKGAVSLKLELEDIRLGIDEAIPCGLIVNELVTNSLIHAFPGDRKGEIRVTLRPEEGNTGYLVVSDDGAGLPESLDFKHTSSLGLQMVCTLVEQLDGSIELDRSKGTEFRIRFQAMSHNKRL